MKVILYSKHNCQQCTAQKRMFLNAGIEYTEVNVEDDPGALAFIKEDLGYQAAPVVYAEINLPDDHTGEVHWSGFDPTKTKILRELIDNGK